jgi:hypothetical protein
MQDKRVRSPNYPALSLPDALDKVQALYKAQHTHAAPREVVAKNIGYSGLNGASATAISALHKYGLLEKMGDEVKVSDRALRILHPHSPAEKSAAIRDAAGDPALFAELAERFPGAMPNDELLRNYLLRKGFAQSAVSSVILAYRDTSEFAAREGAPYDSASDQGAAPVPSTQIAPTPHTLAAPPPDFITLKTGVKVAVSDNERLVARYDLEDGAYVQIVATSDVPTEEALDWVEILITNKRRELDRRMKRSALRDAEADREANDD